MVFCLLKVVHVLDSKYTHEHVIFTHFTAFLFKILGYIVRILFGPIFKRSIQYLMS